jgi:hypothetical protein
MAAHAQGKWERAIAELGSILSRLHTIGGSHAQRDLFEQIYLDAWLRAEQNHEALKLLEKRFSAGRYIPLLQVAPDEVSNSQGLLQFPSGKTTSERVTPLSPVGNEANANLQMRTRITIEPHQVTPWLEGLSQSQGLALAKTHVQNVATGGHLSA